MEWLAKTRTVKITVNNGYTIPEGTDVIVEIDPPDNNPNKVDINLTVTLGKELEPQFNDVYKILASKFGPGPAKEVTEYIRQKKDEWSEVPAKWWIFNDQKVYVASNSGDFVIQITVWQPGVK
ncbi:copper amine oxidase domain-containing protein [Thermincola ferriacetica]|uniref:Copper amine oxidase domain-containing protein n=1 Tax=Thermincola ferriacetica TaxID=281456 RepID=A0A0L6VXW2_9FIRM|nr:copper amine oxidase domain-containing protein [Thermincola ferriacetica]